MTNTAFVATGSGRTQRVLARYGELLTLDDLAAILKYPSPQAVRKAHARGRLPVRLFRLPNRRELFASTLAVVAVLNQECKDGDIPGQSGTMEDTMT
jgi:hypothetical protein